MRLITSIFSHPTPLITLISMILVVYVIAIIPGIIIKNLLKSRDRMIVKTFMKSKIFRLMNTPLLLFYKKEYLTGYYFENKVAGWLWAWKAVPFKLLGINTSLPFPADITVRMHNPNNIVLIKMIFIFSNRPGRILIIFQQLYI